MCYRRSITQLHPSLGPFAFADVFTGSVPVDWIVANPRCLKRDLALLIAERYNNATAIKYLMATLDITAFQGNMSGADINAGVHGGGHYTLGGSGGDFFASPNDPAFWVHHGMIDKLWTEWQALDKPVRESALNGTNTIFDPPGATEVTLDYVQNLGYLSETRATREMMKVGYNGFCYRYE
jgi:tyrosinase